ncbi:MAG: PRC-barrel domain-containing protein [Coriobacteriia bacterium]|nr:PRC-barrel domain-containing protein [Coriobacteriia bacterium]
MRTSELAGAPVLSADGSELGTVGEVLFHPTEARVVGLSVRPPRLGGVVSRAERYIEIDQSRVEGGAVVYAAKKLPSVEKSERRIGVPWDETVQWRGMPVAAASGDVIGSVADVVFDWSTGAVQSLEISSGVLGDVSVGKLSAGADVVAGFSGGAVRLTCEYKDLPASGGVAKAAAAGAVLAKETGSKVAKRAYDTGMSAAIAVGRSFKSGTGRRMLDAVKKAVSDAMREDE